MSITETVWSYVENCPHSARRLARETGLSEPVISQIRKRPGHTMSGETLNKLAAYFGLELRKVDEHQRTST